MQNTETLQISNKQNLREQSLAMNETLRLNCGWGKLALPVAYLITFLITLLTLESKSPMLSPGTDLNQVIRDKCDRLLA